MKAFKITIVVLCMLIALAAGTTYAAVEVGSVALGGSSQERGVNVSSTFTIKNTFNESITINSASPSADAKYTLATSGLSLPQSLAAGATLTVTLTGVVPKDLDAVNDEFEPIALDIGTITVGFTNQTNQTGTASNKVTMQAANELEINSADIEIVSTDGTDDGGGIDDGDDFDAKPGDSITVEIKVENTFASRTNIEFRSARVFMDIDDDADFDIDDDSDTVTLDAGEDDIVTFTMTVDTDADDTSHQVRLVVTGDDEFGAKHGQELTFDLNVERETHDIQVSRVTATPSRVTCSADVSTIDVEVRVENRGRRNERNAAISVSAPSFGGFSNTIEDIELDADKSITRRFKIALPDSVRSGPHTITARSFYSNDIEMDSKDVVVSVDACVNASSTPPTPSTPPPIMQPPTPPPAPSIPPASQPGASGVSSTPTTGGFSDSFWYIVALVALIVLVGAIIIGVVAYAILKK